MWKNKHVVVAMLVAPVLALVAWFAVDRMVAEAPQAAREGGAYALVAKPSCRYASGECELVNGNFRLVLRLTAPRTLTLSASHALTAVQVATGRAPDGVSAPLSMSRLQGEEGTWRVELESFEEDDVLRVLARRGETSYFSETTLAFTAGP